MRGPEILTKHAAEKLVQSACVAMATELARLRAENTVLRDTLVKANELHEKTITGSAENERAWTAELARLRADLAEARADVARFEAALDVSQWELAEARAERVDALNRLGAGQVEYDSLYASLLDCQTERDEAEQITAAYAEEVAEAEDDLDRQRRTILALVEPCVSEVQSIRG